MSSLSIKISVTVKITVAYKFVTSALSPKNMFLLQSVFAVWPIRAECGRAGLNLASFIQQTKLLG